MLKTPCEYKAQEGESRWAALRRRKKDVEVDRDDLMELITYMQAAPEDDVLRIFHRIRANDFTDLLRLIRHTREDGHSIQRNLVSPQGMNVQQRLTSIHALLESFGQLPTQEPVQSGQAGVWQRAMSISSSASGASAESHPSNPTMGSTSGQASSSSQGAFRPSEG